MPLLTDTHPFICFRLDATRIPATTWLALGECVSKIRHLIGTPLIPAYREEMSKTFVSKGVQATAAIEGNTLSEQEVRDRLDKALDLPPSQEHLGAEIDGLADAYGRLADALNVVEGGYLTEARIKEYNRTVLAHMDELAEGVVPGEYVTYQHGVGPYRAPAPEDIRRLMPEFVSWINDPDQWSSQSGVDPLAIEVMRAVVAHLYLAWIHPFGDGNGRVARLVEAELLGRAGVPSVAYHLLADHYNRTRPRYYDRLRQTSETEGGDPYTFLDYAARGLADGLRRQIDMVKAQHREVVWRDYVADRFRDKKDTKAMARRRKLAMDLGSAKQPVAKAELPGVSPRVLSAYQGKTMKTVSRDLRYLQDLGLIRREQGGYVAAIEILAAFVEGPIE